MVTSTELAEAERRLQGNLPTGSIVVMATMPDPESAGQAVDSSGVELSPIPELWPVEADFIANAIDRRRLEFAVGRHLARRAIAALGGGPAAIPVGSSRQPIWPDGFVGSISHTRAMVAAAAAPVSAVRSIGIDIEREGSVSDEVATRILTEPELERHRAEPQQDLATTIFSAKESVYKTTHPVTDTWLGFEDATIIVDETDERFLAEIGSDVDHPMAGKTLSGRLFRALDHVITSSSLREI